MTEGVLYTIGHSNHDLLDFVFLLNNFKTDYLVDVRSTPYSKYASSYNREFLKNYLAKKNIKYVNLQMVIYF